MATPSYDIDSSVRSSPTPTNIDLRLEAPRLYAAGFQGMDNDGRISCSKLWFSMAPRAGYKPLNSTEFIDRLLKSASDDPFSGHVPLWENWSENPYAVHSGVARLDDAVKIGHNWRQLAYNGSKRPDAVDKNGCIILGPDLDKKAAFDRLEGEVFDIRNPIFNRPLDADEAYQSPAWRTLVGEEGRLYKLISNVYCGSGLNFKDGHIWDMPEGASPKAMKIDLNSLPSGTILPWKFGPFVEGFNATPARLTDTDAMVIHERLEPASLIQRIQGLFKAKRR